jgi:putative oxidoreductase
VNIFSKGLSFYYRSSNLLAYAAPALDIALRLFLANVFFKSGLTKIQTWDSTLYLFREEYQVPLLPPEFAAYLATSAELALPVLLALGLFGRFAALGLFILNAVAAYSYYDQLSPAGLLQHLYWGMLLAILLVHGLGKWSMDRWMENYLGKMTGK